MPSSSRTTAPVDDFTLRRSFADDPRHDCTREPSAAHLVKAISTMALGAEVAGVPDVLARLLIRSLTDRNGSGRIYRRVAEGLDRCRRALRLTPPHAPARRSVDAG